MAERMAEIKVPIASALDYVICDYEGYRIF